jgi:FkbM family methyltransferase
MNNITENSIVFEIGAYEGQWANMIATKYNPIMYVFEPQKWAYDNCVTRLKKFEKVKVFNIALGVEDGMMKMGDFRSDGASLMKAEKEKCDQKEPQFEDVKVVEIGKFLEENKINEIDFCQINIEGGEYVLLPHMIEKGTINKIKYLIVQFHMHPWFPGEERKITELLSISHRQIFGENKGFSEWERR